MVIIFLTVMHDRHCDDEYTAHTTFEGAIKNADNFMLQYGTRYKWEREDIRGALYRHHTDTDDGPNVHIEEIELSD